MYTYVYIYIYIFAKCLKELGITVGKVVYLFLILLIDLKSINN